MTQRVEGARGRTTRRVEGVRGRTTRRVERLRGRSSVESKRPEPFEVSMTPRLASQLKIFARIENRNRASIVLENVCSLGGERTVASPSNGTEFDDSSWCVFAPASVFTQVASVRGSRETFCRSAHPQDVAGSARSRVEAVLFSKRGGFAAGDLGRIPSGRDSGRAVEALGAGRGITRMRTEVLWRGGRSRRCL
jgi:hypothetical protein